MSPYQPEWDLDLALGQAQEIRLFGILTDIRNGCHVEVKSDFFLNPRFYLEVQDRRRGRSVWRDTGFRTSEADLFILNKPGLNACHIYRTSDLLDLEAAGLLGSLVDGGQRGDCPTRGHVITPTQLDAAIAHRARRVDQFYDQEEKTE